MAREEFIDSLRRASRLLPAPSVSSDQGSKAEAYYSSSLHSTDLWLTKGSVSGFDINDFADLPLEARCKLAKEVASFQAIASVVPQNKPATKSQSSHARKHLQEVIKIVRDRILPEWLEAQQEMISEATAAAREQGWYVQRDEKELRESLLGKYRAPRLHIRTENNEVILDPIAYFGSGRRGVVDLVVMPTFETQYLVTYKDGNWLIVSTHGTQHARPFNRATLTHIIAKLRQF